MASNLFSSESAVLRVDLNSAKYKEQLDKLAHLPDAYDMAVRKGIEEFCLRLMKKLQENMALTGVEHHMGEVMFDISDKGIKMTYADPVNSGVIFLEYGVGATGGGTPHPRVPSSWQYGSGPTIAGDGNWWYPLNGRAPHPNQKVKKGKNGELYARTSNQGQVGRRFVYNTWLWGTRLITQIIGSVIRRELKKYGGR